MPFGITQIVRGTQIKSGTAYDWVTNDSTGAMSQTAVTASRAVATDSNGLPVASATTATELGYVSGVTSSIQTQLNALAYGLSWKQPSLAATVGTLNALFAGGYTATATTITENVATDGDFTPIDAITLAATNRVLIKNETSGTFNITVNGSAPVYTVTSAAALDVGTIVHQAAGPKDSVISAINYGTNEITLSGGDAATFATGSTDYDNKQFNGIYAVTVLGDGATTAWVLTRTSDMDAWAEVPSAATFVEEGTVNADNAFVCTSDPGGTLGTTDITFVQFSSTSFVFNDTNSINFTTAGLTVTADVIPDTTTANTLAVTITANGVGSKISSTNFTDGGTETLTLASAGVLYANTNIVTREVPTGLINSSNLAFDTANNFVSGSEMVYLNGLLQESGAGNDYTVTDANTFTFEAGNAPITGSVLLVSYWKL